MAALFEAHTAVTDEPRAPFELAARDYPRRGLTKGDCLYRVGDVADSVYLVGEGLIKLTLDVSRGRERIVGIAGPGDIIGALTPAHSHYQETAEALSPRVEVQVVDVANVDQGVAGAVFSAAGAHLLRLKSALEDSELPAAARLARALLRLGQRFGHTSDERIVHLTLPLTHDNLASLVGAARETTTTLLSEMREAGVLHGTRGRYTFHVDKMNDYALATAE